MAIAQGILDIALNTARQNEAQKVFSIRIQVGQMTRVDPESLKFCFSTLSVGSPAAEAELDIVIVPLVARCIDCGQQFSVEQYCFVCPKCQSSGVQILSGRELKVEHLEVE